MNEELVRIKLENLRSDLLIQDEGNLEVVSLLKEINSGHEEQVLNKYIENNLPINVSNFEIKPSKDVDMNNVLIDFSMGYDKFIYSLEKDANSLIRGFNEALKLLTIIFKLPLPYSYMLYLRYYKYYSIIEVVDSMNFSKSSYYRYLDEGIKMITDYYNHGYYHLPDKRIRRKKRFIK